MHLRVGKFVEASTSSLMERRPPKRYDTVMVRLLYVVTCEFRVLACGIECFYLQSGLQAPKQP